MTLKCKENVMQPGTYFTALGLLMTLKHRKGICYIHDLNDSYTFLGVSWCPSNFLPESVKAEQATKSVNSNVEQWEHLIFPLCRAKFP